MFEHSGFRKYAFEQTPLNRDIFLMDVKWAAEHEAAWIGLFDESKQFDPVGYIGYAAARQVNANAIELSWYPNITDRFHEVIVTLPRDQFVECVGAEDFDCKPHLFVKGEWFESLYSRAFSAFALVDAIGVKNALMNGTLSNDGLLALRNGIDNIAAQYEDVSFISFGDSLLLKSNWRSGNFERGVTCNYKPESLILIASQLKSLFQKTIGMNIYAVLGQGSNEYYEDSALHISEPYKNHVSLNCLGLPFAQLFAIDEAVRSALRSRRHEAADLYMDSNFFHSLRFKFSFAKNKHSVDNASYRSPLISDECHYFFADFERMISNFEDSQAK